MFEYVRNEYNPDPMLVLAPAPARPDRFVRYLSYSVAPTFDLPRSLDELRALHGRKYWQTLRRKERRLREDVPDARFRVVTDPVELRDLLPRVQDVFAERWATEYTSSGWTTPAGFAPYATAMLELASRGSAELAVLEGDGRVLSFAYCLHDGRTYHFYQHASTVDERYRRYSVGKLLVAKLIADLVEHRRCEVFDFMTGQAEYKREWATTNRAILFRVEEERTPIGALRFAVRLAYRRGRLAVQFGHPRVRQVTKRVMLARQRAHLGRSPA